MHRSICVVYDRARFAHLAYRALLRSRLGEQADSVSVHDHGVVDDDLRVSQTRPTAGAAWGGISMALLGATIAFFAFSSGMPASMTPCVAIPLGALFGGCFGALGGALIGTTEPERGISDVASSLTHGRVAVIAEFASATTAAAAERLLLHLRGAVGRSGP